MTDRLLLTVNYSFTEKNVMILFRRILMPVMALTRMLTGGGSNWLRSPDNDHASGYDADTSANGEDPAVAGRQTENGWKPTGARRGRGVAPSIARKGDIPGKLVLANPLARFDGE